MPTDTKLQNLIINDLTEEQYKSLTPNENELYLTPNEVEPKTISLFGTHSILVPSTSSDTNIELFRHNITITGHNTDNSIQIICYLNEVSSNRLDCNSPTDFNTLFGNQVLSCTGVLRNGNTKNTIINSVVLPTGNRGFTMIDTSDSTKMVSTISLATFATITFEDDVKTI